MVYDPVADEWTTQPQMLKTARRYHDSIITTAAALGC